MRDYRSTGQCTFWVPASKLSLASFGPGTKNINNWMAMYEGGVVVTPWNSDRPTTSWDPSLLRHTEFLLIQVFFKLKAINSFWFNLKKKKRNSWDNLDSFPFVFWGLMHFSGFWPFYLLNKNAGKRATTACNLLLFWVFNLSTASSFQPTLEVCLIPKIFPWPVIL